MRWLASVFICCRLPRTCASGSHLRGPLELQTLASYAHMHWRGLHLVAFPGRQRSAAKLIEHCKDRLRAYPSNAVMCHGRWFRPPGMQCMALVPGKMLPHRLPQGGI